jgi:hypothetical protein
MDDMAVQMRNRFFVSLVFTLGDPGRWLGSAPAAKQPSE